MQFLLQYWYDPATQFADDSPEAASEFQAWMALAKEMDEAGIAVAGAPLQPPETATTLRPAIGRALSGSPTTAPSSPPQSRPGI